MWKRDGSMRKVKKRKKIKTEEKPFGVWARKRNKWGRECAYHTWTKVGIYIWYEDGKSMKLQVGLFKAPWKVLLPEQDWLVKIIKCLVLRNQYRAKKYIKHGQEKGLRDRKWKTVTCIYCIQLLLQCEHELFSKKKFVNIKMTGVGTLISPLGGENCLWKSCGSQFKRIICGIVASNYCWSLAFGEYEQNSIQRLANAAFTAWGTNKALKKRALNVESEAHSLSPDSLDLHGRSLGLVTCLKIGTCHNFTGFSIT